MTNYIIKYVGIIEGKKRIFYHENITNVDAAGGYMDVYSECITFQKNKAKIFFCKNEATKIMGLFSYSIKKGKVIGYKKIDNE